VSTRPAAIARADAIRQMVSRAMTRVVETAGDADASESARIRMALNDIQGACIAIELIAGQIAGRT
jgi:hypothetical protein